MRQQRMDRLRNKFGKSNTRSEVKFNRLSRITISLLFGKFDYDIPLHRDERITIITAPNGYGKSTILRLTNALMCGDYNYLASIPFKDFRLEFVDGQELSVHRDADKTPYGPLQHVYWSSQVGKPITLSLQALSSKEDNKVVRYLSNLISREEDYSTSRFEHNRIADEDTASFVKQFVANYGTDRLRTQDQLERKEIEELRNSLPMLFISTDRLYTESSESGDGYKQRTLTVNEISQRVWDLVRRAMSEYARVSRRIDKNFTEKVLKSVNESEVIHSVPTAESLNALRLQERKVKEMEVRLNNLGFFIDEQIAEGTTSTVNTISALRVLQLHYDDMASKYSSLNDVAARVELLLECLSSLYSHKTVKFTIYEGLQVVTDDGYSLPLNKLSSGEQHLLVLYGRLLFGAGAPLVMLDEPEISLHLEWQMDFVQHLELISKIHPFDLIVATHSPYLINGRDELMVELSDMVD